MATARCRKSCVSEKRRKGARPLPLSSGKGGLGGQHQTKLSWETPESRRQTIASVRHLLKALQDKIGEHPLLAEAIGKVELGSEHSGREDRWNVVITPIPNGT
jgi:hypothetical protein